MFLRQHCQRFDKLEVRCEVLSHQEGDLEMMYQSALCAGR